MRAIVTRVYDHQGEIEVGDEASLGAALNRRDAIGGGEFWLAENAGGYPCLAIRVSGDYADIHYFPKSGHPGFRFMNDTDDSSPGEYTIFRYLGSDPADGTEVPNEFVVSHIVAVTVAWSTHGVPVNCRRASGSSSSRASRAEDEEPPNGSLHRTWTRAARGAGVSSRRAGPGR